MKPDKSCASFIFCLFCVLILMYFCVQIDIMYKAVIRSLLFKFDPEAVHYFTFDVIKLISKIPLISSLIRWMFKLRHPSLERELFGLKFQNPVGLAAGFDKNAILYNELSNFGFGFIEIGTVTPKAQDGNPKKRLFRLKDDNGLINRMGFNNAGLDAVIDNLKTNQKRLIIGVQKPILLKIAPDLNDTQLDEIIELIQKTKIAGVIASNTSVSRDGLKTSRQKLEAIGNGGLSGQPIKSKSTRVIQYLSKNSNKAFPIIGVGGIHSAKDALEKLDAGADLVQIYTGFVYEGPTLIKRINKALIQRAKTI